jgi:hypothetical protein
LRADLFKKIVDSLPDEEQSEHKHILDVVEDIFEYFEFLSVYSLEADTDSVDTDCDGLDEAILHGVLKAQRRIASDEGRDERSHMTSRLKMALVYERVDVAKKFVFNDEKIWDVSEVDKLKI